MTSVVDTRRRAAAAGPQSAAARVREQEKGNGGLYKPRVPIYPKLVHGYWRRIKWALSHFLVNVMDYTVTRRLNFRA